MKCLLRSRRLTVLARPVVVRGLVKTLLVWGGSTVERWGDTTVWRRAGERRVVRPWDTTLCLIVPEGAPVPVTCETIVTVWGFFVPKDTLVSKVTSKWTIVEEMTVFLTFPHRLILFWFILLFCCCFWFTRDRGSR